MQLVAGAPSPNSSETEELTIEVVLQMYVGLGMDGSALRFRTMVQGGAPPARVTPVTEMLFDPAVAAVVPGGVQPSTNPLGVSTVKPAGKVSVKEIPVTARN